MGVFSLYIVSITIFIGCIKAESAIPSTAQATQLNINDQLAQLETELPHFNLYRSHGDWILRATSDNNLFFTRSDTTCNNNRVTISHYFGDKLFYSAIARHIRGSKIIEWNGNNGNDIRKSVGLFQDSGVIISVVIKQDNQRVLIVLVNSLKNSQIDNSMIQKIIENQLLSKTFVGHFIDDLVRSLLFVNNNLPKRNYARPSFPIGDEDLVDADLMNAVSNWTMYSISNKRYIPIHKIETQAMANKLFVATYDKDGKLFLTSLFGYLDDTRVLFGDVVRDNHYYSHWTGVIYADLNTIVLLSKVGDDPMHLTAWGRDGAKFDPEYTKKIIDNLLMFSADVNRVIKDMLPNLIWK